MWLRPVRWYDLVSVAAGATLVSPERTHKRIRPAKRLRLTALGHRREPHAQGYWTSGRGRVDRARRHGSANAADKLKIGVTATLEGTYTVLGEDGMRGYELAVEAHHGKAGGKEIESIVGSTDASPDSAIRAAKKLVEQDKVDVLMSPLSGSEGIAIRDYSKTQPQITVMNASSGALETTYGDPSAGITPSPTFFRNNMDGAQWQAGLGDYAYNVKHYKKIATVGEDYSFVYTQVMGLVVEYCKAGGEITKRFWVPLGTKDFASVISSLPDDVDAIYLGLGGADAVNFLNQYQQAGGHAHLLGGSIMVDQTVLSSKGKAKEALIGTVAASGMADNDPSPKWQAFVKAYQTHAEGRLLQERVRAVRRCSRSTTTIRQTPCLRRSTRSMAIFATTTRNSARR